MTILSTLAWLAILPAALLTAPYSMRLALALALAWIVRPAYLATGFEALRWVSAIVGLVGAWELGDRAYSRHVFNSSTYANARARTFVYGLGNAQTLEDARDTVRLGRIDAIAAICIASMAGDGVALLAHRAWMVWVMPPVQLCNLFVICAIAVWPQRRAS